MKWINLHEEEFEKAIEQSGGVCVMPIGCIEKHAQHLPLGTDIKIAEAVAELAAEEEEVCIFPTFQFGEIAGIRQHHGSVILPPKLQVEILETLCDEIARNGFKKIILLNGHGGNCAMLDFLVNSVIYKKRDYVVTFRHAFDHSLEDMLRDLENGEVFPELTEEDVALIRDFVTNGKLGGHADFEETAALLAIAPECVNLDRADAESGERTHATDEYAKWGLDKPTRFWYLEYPNHYAGAHPTGVNDRIGRALLRKWVARQVGAVRLMKQDDTLLNLTRKWQDNWVE